MLFARVPKGRLLLVEVCGLSLCVGCNCMAGSIEKGIHDSLIGILVES
jgi:hypothetical protein